MNSVLPPSGIPGFVPTLNAKGWMTLRPDSVSEAFIEYAAQCGQECLDIGCAYGVATLPALARGARMRACDMEPQHLDILWQQTPGPDRARLRIQPATLPEVDFPPESFGAILCARALHFLSGRDISLSISKMADWLSPGGRMYLVSDSPYGGPWAIRAPDYERRKAAGDPWPGLVSSFAELLKPGDDPKRHPAFINPLDPDILQREVELAGLLTIESHWLPGFTDNSPPRIRAGVIAVRPDGARL